MENIKTTRYSELVAIIDFAKENGYEGSTEKLLKVLDQWKPKGGSNSENAALAVRILDRMEEEVSYTSKDIMALAPDQLRTVSKVAVVMKGLIEEGAVLKSYDGKRVQYTKAQPKNRTDRGRRNPSPCQVFSLKKLNEVFVKTI